MLLFSIGSFFVLSTITFAKVQKSIANNNRFVLVNLSYYYYGRLLLGCVVKCSDRSTGYV